MPPSASSASCARKVALDLYDEEDDDDSDNASTSLLPGDSRRAADDVRPGTSSPTQPSSSILPAMFAAISVPVFVMFFTSHRKMARERWRGSPSPPPVAHPPPLPRRRRRVSKSGNKGGWSLGVGTVTNANYSAITLESMAGCKICANAPPLPNVSLGWWTPEYAAAEASAKAAVAATMAAAVLAAVPLSASAVIMPDGRIPIGQRVRVRWADGPHLGTVSEHKLESDASSPLLHCIDYDTGFKACTSLAKTKQQYELVQGGVFEAAPPVASPPPQPSPPPPHGPRSLLPSCCHRGGSWAGACGPRAAGGKTWHMGLRSCNLHKCAKCGAVRMTSGQVDLNCCNSGGSWAGVCGQPAMGFAFSWKEGYQICNMNSDSS